VTKDTAVRHNSVLVEAISQATGTSRRTIRRGLDDLINPGHLASNSRGYLAIMKTEPPADQARGPLVSVAPLAPIGDPARQGGRSEK
jgi:DeoR/GlpR family transcriptional regulator of sugar metabolism